MDMRTALGPTDPDDGSAGRRQRGFMIAAIARIKKYRIGYRVPAQSGAGTYVVNLDNGDPICTCPDFEKRQLPCKHVYAVEVVVGREEGNDDDLFVETRTTQRVTYGQNWPAYNQAQTHERYHFTALLRELCDTVPQPPQGRGRPRLPISDVLYGFGLKVYSMRSGRRAMSDFHSANAEGMLDRPPSFTSTFRYLEDPAMVQVLKGLVVKSAQPLGSLETHFGVDSSGFSTSVYDRWLDHKWGKARKKARWVKCHLICGVRTNIVTDVEITGPDANDAPYLAPLVETTARTFQVDEVSADKAYLSKRNLQTVADVGGRAYIPFKSNSMLTLPTDEHAIWDQAFHYYNLHRAEFLKRYHKRSNVETTFAMIKAKFGGSVRAKTPAAQANEVLVKVLCHNIAVLIRSMYELNVPLLFDAKATA